MAITTFTGNVADVFAAGTSLEARPASNWPDHKRPPAAGTTPLGAATATAVSAASGVVSFTGLADSTEYYVSDAAGTRYVRITTFPVAGVEAGSGTVEATAANSGSAYTVTAPDHGERELRLTLTASTTVTLTGGTTGEVCAVQLLLIQDTTGSRAVTWPDNLDWGVSGAPVLSTAAGKTERVYLTTDDGGASWQGALIGSGYTSPTAPSAPTSLSGDGSVSNTATLTWVQGAANGSAVTQNQIWRSTVSGSETLLTTISANTTYSDTTVVDGTTYYYKVKAVNAVGASSLSSEVSVVVGQVTVAADNFNRADATATTPSNGLIGQSTPTGSKTWLNLNAANLWHVASNAATANAIDAKAGVNAGVADCTVSADIVASYSTGNPGLILRWADSNNFMNAIVDAGGLYIQKKVAGSQTNVVGPVGGANSNGSTVTVQVAMVGSSVVMFRNGVQVASVTVSDAALVSNTKHGLLAGHGSSGDSFDNFAITSP